jgi:hypothetical protein
MKMQEWKWDDMAKLNNIKITFYLSICLQVQCVRDTCFHSVYTSPIVWFTLSLFLSTNTALFIVTGSYSVYISPICSLFMPTNVFTSIGLPYLNLWGFRMCSVTFKLQLIPTSKPSFSKINVAGHSTLQYRDNNMIM